MPLPADRQPLMTDEPDGPDEVPAEKPDPDGPDGAPGAEADREETANDEVMATLD